MSETTASSLLQWYDRAKRALPWRGTNDPYAVWVSEAMLQQTQVATALPYYERWMERFPSAESLAEADEQEALAHWQGLGYYSRCRNLQAGARLAVRDGFPASADEWGRMPGVGSYTAAALASLTLNESVAVVDGNVMRVFARQCGSFESGERLRKEASSWANGVIDPSRPGDFNQAMMELGATVCKPVAPDCGCCPIAATCIARVRAIVDQLPVKVPKAKPTVVSKVSWIPFCEGGYGIRPIQWGSWWKGMWEFPTADSPSDLAALCPGAELSPLGTVRQTVTKHRLEFEVSLAHVPMRCSHLTWLKESELETYPMPAPMRKAFALIGL